MRTPASIALRHDIGQAVVARKFDLDVRILRKKFLELGPEHVLDGVVGRHDPDRACGLVAQLAERGDLCFNLIEAGADAFQQTLARFSGRHRARRAGQQADAKAFFKLADGMAQRRLREAGLLGRGREAALTGDRHKRKKVVYIVAAHS